MDWLAPFDFQIHGMDAGGLLVSHDVTPTAGGMPSVRRAKYSMGRSQNALHTQNSKRYRRCRPARDDRLSGRVAGDV